MTRKDFNMIAQALKAAKPVAPDHYQTWLEAVESIAQTLKTTNERFDTQRFINACH